MDKEEAEYYYNELRKKYTDKEISESHVFSVDMIENEKVELREYLKTKRRTLTEKEREQVRDFIKRSKGC